MKRYDYYHCTHKRKYIQCEQNGVIAEAELNAQIESEISKLTILPEFRDWAVQVLNGWNDNEIKVRSQKYESESKNLIDLQNQIDSLTKMRYRNLISDDEFISERKSLQNQLTELKQRRTETEDRAQNWLELTERVFDFARYARERFSLGNTQTKKEILAALGTSYTLKDNVLKIEMNKWFQPVLKYNEKQAIAQKRSEPNKNPVNTGIVGRTEIKPQFWGA